MKVFIDSIGREYRILHGELRNGEVIVEMEGVRATVRITPSMLRHMNELAGVAQRPEDYDLLQRVVELEKNMAAATNAFASSPHHELQIATLNREINMLKVQVADLQQSVDQLVSEHGADENA